MASIRTHTGEIRICTSCGQPAYLAGPDEEAQGLWCHFDEQWDGIYCPKFPLADDVVAMNWDEQSLIDLRRSYPGSRPAEGLRHSAV